jgi:hypothetical protein
MIKKLLLILPRVTIYNVIHLKPLTLEIHSEIFTGEIIVRDSLKY